MGSGWEVLWKIVFSWILQSCDGLGESICFLRKSLELTMGSFQGVGKNKFYCCIYNLQVESHVGGISKLCVSLFCKSVKSVLGMWMGDG